MRSPRTELYVHLIWATWDRLPLVTPGLKEPLLAAIIAKCRDLGAQTVAVEAMPDHVHLLARFPSTLSIAVLVKETKGASSHLATHVLAPDAFFKWQGAYAAFTVAAKDVPAVKSYIANQASHHGRGDIRPEWEHLGTDDHEPSE